MKVTDFFVFVLIVHKGLCDPDNGQKVPIYKCCDISKSLVDGTCEANNQINGETENEFEKLFLQQFDKTFEDNYYVKNDTFFNCDKNMFPLDDKDNYQIKPNGNLVWQTHSQTQSTIVKHEINYEEYCLEIVNGNFSAITCQNPFVHPIGQTINKLGMLISIPFLFVTLMVYLILPDKKIQTKCLMAYVTCLMLAYSFLVYLQLNSSIDGNACEVVAACGIYFFMSTFCWMNITCIDMYWTFSGRRGMIQGSSSKWKQFGMYCAFANGAPLILLAIIFGLNTHPTNSWYHPGLGHGRCWLTDGMAQLLYFYGPMAVLMIMNMCLFIFTAVTIHQKLAEGQRMMQSNESQRHYDSNKQDYKLYIKLFIAMGINWIMEFISWIVDWSLGSRKIPEIWYVTDFGNAVYGFFIFFIFICKRTVWIKLKQRYYILMGKPNMARALSTRTSGYQMSQTERTNVEDSTIGTNKYNQI